MERADRSNVGLGVGVGLSGGVERVAGATVTVAWGRGGTPVQPASVSTSDVQARARAAARVPQDTAGA
jgi:hypothetical protein